LIGFQPERDWHPTGNWEKTLGVYYPDFDYSTQGYKNFDKHLFVLEKPICRYGENRYALSEIKDYVFIPNLEENEIIIDVPNFLSSSGFGENISWRFDFKWEMHTTVECTNAPPRAIMLARYDINKLPDKIEPGTQLSVEVFQGWTPDIYTNTFKEFSEVEISCIITFDGY
jgi:hypothetical protein